MNCTSKNVGGGIFCQSKSQNLYNLCLNYAGQGNAVHLLLAYKDSIENREIVCSSFVSCYETLSVASVLESLYRIDHTEDTNISACKDRIIYMISTITKSFFFMRCIISDVMRNHLIWFPEGELRKHLKQCNVAITHSVTQAQKLLIIPQWFMKSAYSSKTLTLYCVTKKIC